MRDCHRSLTVAAQILFVGQDGILRAGCFTRARLRRLPIGAQVNNLPHNRAVSRQVTRRG